MEPFTLVALGIASALLLKKGGTHMQTLDNTVAVTGLTPAERMKSIAKVYAPVISSQSARLGIPPAAAAAVISIESGGRGFGKDGRLLIRFEPHVFHNRTAGKTTAGFDVPDSHASQAAEYEAFGQAKTLNEDAAYKSISMGAGQIMGFNAQRVGYSSAKAMYDAFQTSLQAQLEGIFEFIRTDSKLLQAVRNSDWTTFAERYNGSGQHGYDAKLAKAAGLYPKDSQVA